MWRLCFSLVVVSSFVDCIPLRSGRARVAWQLVDSAGSQVSCMPGEQVHLVIAGDRFVAQCSDFSLTTLRIVTGAYSARLEFHPAGGGAVTTVVESPNSTATAPAEFPMRRRIPIPTR